MNKQQHIELIVAMLNEMEDKHAAITTNILAQYISAERFYTLYTEIDEKWKRAEKLNNMAKEFAERLKAEEE